MTEHAPANVTAARKPVSTDSALRIIIVLLVASVLGLGGLLGYTVWQGDRAERTATPAARAIRSLETVVKKSPNSAAARVRLGEALAAAGSLDAATEQFSTAIRLDKNHTGAYLDLGILAMQDKNYGPAEKYFDKVVELTQGTQFEAMNARREQALFHLGEIALDQKRFDDATGYFKGALRIRKDASDTYYLLAVSLRGMDEDAAALKQLEAAIAFDPNYPEAHYLWGVILLEQGDRINAATHLRKSVDLAPEQKQPAEALKKLGSADDALEQGRAQLADGKSQAALDSALLATVLEPDNSEATLFYVDVLMKRGEKAVAVKTLTQAIKDAPADKDLKARLTVVNASK